MFEKTVLDMLKFLNKNLIWILFLTSCIVGIANFKSYGISWDEEAQQLIGEKNYSYIFSGDKSFHQFQDRDYGVAFELPLIFIEKALGLTDSRDIYLCRHLCSHFFYIVGALFCFLLIELLYSNKLLSAIGFLLVMLNPVLYAHSFYNSKDIPFMVMFFICFYIAVKAFRKQNLINFLLLGIATALLVNMRLMGILFFAVVLFCLILDYFIPVANKISGKSRVAVILTFIGATALFLYGSWPFLWERPFANFVLAFQNMSNFRWDGLVLFKGEYMRTTALSPWYIPTWFCITNPILYLGIGFCGAILIILNFIKKPRIYIVNNDLRFNLIFGICFCAPVIVIILLHSVLYDSWRQLFFIYPAFVMLAIYAIHKISATSFRKYFFVLLFSVFTYILYLMISLNPHQQVYFNRFVDLNTPEKLRSQYELDYWGASYKQSLFYILENDKAPQIKISVENYPGWQNYKIIPKSERGRIQFVNIEEADYFVTNYRDHPYIYEDLQDKSWFKVKVFNNTINEVFKLK